MPTESCPLLQLSSLRSPFWLLPAAWSWFGAQANSAAQALLLRDKQPSTHTHTHPHPGGLLSSARPQDGLLTSWQGCWCTGTASLGTRQLADRFLSLHLITVQAKTIADFTHEAAAHPYLSHPAIGGASPTPLPQEQFFSHQILCLWPISSQSQKTSQTNKQKPTLQQNQTHCDV